MNSKKPHILKIAALSLLIACTLLLLVSYLGALHIDNVTYQNLISLLLFSFNIIILLAWLYFGMTASLICLTIASIFMSLAVAVSRDPFLNWHLAVFCLVMLISYYNDRKNSVVQALQVAELEEIEKDVNTLSNEYQQHQLQTKALKKSFSKFSILKEVTESLSSSLSLAEVANLIVKNSFNIIGKADTCMLFLVDEKRHKLILASIHKSSEFKGLKVEEADLFDGRVLRKKQPLIIQDIRKDYRFDYETIKKQTREFRSLICTPLISKDRSIGVIRLDAIKPEVFISEDLRILNIIADLGAVAVGNAKLFERTEELAITDGLTNCYVQRYMRQLAREEIKNTASSENKMSFLMIDIDYFKKYNDDYGHIAGDIVLKGAARMFMRLAGPKAIVSRYGGEEFAIVLPGTDKKEAVRIAEEIRRKVGERAFYLRRQKTKITICVGVAAFARDTRDLDQLIDDADKALYEAKKSGRNKVCVF